MRPFIVVLGFLTICLLAVMPASGQLGSFTKKPAPSPAAAPPPTPQTVKPAPAVAAKAPSSPTAGGTTKRASTPVVKKSIARAPSRPQVQQPPPPPPPIVQASDRTLFEQAALCKVDPRAILSRMKPTASNNLSTAYDLASSRLTVNGWQVDLAFYTNRSYGSGIIAHDFTVVLIAPTSQVLAFARALPNMALGQVTQGDLVPGSPTKYFFNESHRPTAPPFTFYHTVQLLGWQLYDRAREIQQVTADTGQMSAMTCSQLQVSPAALGLTPTKLGKVARVQTTSSLPPEIIAGSYRINKSAKDGCKKLYSQADTYAALDGAIRSDDWGNVVTQLTTMQCKSDLTFFLLGRAMEALGYPKAAQSYYSEAMQYRGGTLSFGTQCAISRGLQSCHGIEVANETKVAQARLIFDPPENLGPYPLRQPG